VVETAAPEIKAHDKAINRNERDIRRLTVEHLSINPGEDVSGCLAVLIMAKDVERIGDHGRNIFGVAARLDTPLTGFRLFDPLQCMQAETGEMLPKLQRAVLESSEEIAHEILAAYKERKKEAKALAEQLHTTEMPSREAVATTLLTRFLTRINAHIGNAASGVIFPLENIDFVSRGLRQEEKDR
jgi:phosphate uptake regulator